VPSVVMGMGVVGVKLERRARQLRAPSGLRKGGNHKRLTGAVF
jgi:hypothetical protein